MRDLSPFPRRIPLAPKILWTRSWAIVLLTAICWCLIPIVIAHLDSEDGGSPHGQVVGIREYALGFLERRSDLSC